MKSDQMRRTLLYYDKMTPYNHDFEQILLNNDVHIFSIFENLFFMFVNVHIFVLHSMIWFLIDVWKKQNELPIVTKVKVTGFLKIEKFILKIESQFLIRIHRETVNPMSCYVIQLVLSRRVPFRRKYNRTYIIKRLVKS